jgi:hypothetical protein
LSDIHPVHTLFRIARPSFFGGLGALSMNFLKLLFACIALNGCGFISQQSVYEGIRSQEKIKPDILKPNPLEMPPYDQYQTERDKLKSPSTSIPTN